MTRPGSLAATAATLIAATLNFAQAQPQAPASAAIEYRSVAEALQALEARDGTSAVVTHPDGWVVVNEPAAAAQWSFTPKDYYAYPAVVRRIIRRSPGGDVSVDTSSVCEAEKSACERLLAEFHELDDRIRQSIKSRSRQGNAPQ